MNKFEKLSKEFTALKKADLARQKISPNLDSARRSELGQFMTIASVAIFMADMFDKLPANIRLLDAGAGVGTLTAAFIHQACLSKNKPDSIEVTCIEVDTDIKLYLEKTLKACAEDCKKANIIFKAKIIADDFISHSEEKLSSQREFFDCAILNPPYKKINSNSKTRTSLRAQGIETTNLYTAFVALALMHLKSSGQLVAITPRSFCNGLYFEPFRRFILQNAAMKKIHIYESRKHAFKDDEVLQENIIFHLVKSVSQPKNVSISSSSNTEDIPVVRKTPFVNVVQPNDNHLFIRLALTDEANKLTKRIQGLKCRLHDLNLTVSTGRVVDFRAKEHLKKDADGDTIPLIYPGHFEGGFIVWPKIGNKKPNALSYNEKTRSLTVPQGTYVLTKRFSSKEEKRRLVAAVYDETRIKADFIGFENHLNYFHCDGKGLNRLLANGLAIYLNSTAVDEYFRQFSGHTQVNATDLRNIYYPTMKQLEQIGKHVTDKLPTQEKIDSIIESIL
jgi:adenine-specific DNA-methyltransferase